MDGHLEVLNVVGVVADVHERSIERADHGTVYVNYVQRPARARDFSIVVRGAGDPGFRHASDHAARKSGRRAAG